MKLTEIEDVALEARTEFGRQVAERLIELRVAENAHELPASTAGKSLQPKGKKKDSRNPGGRADL